MRFTPLLAMATVAVTSVQGGPAPTPVEEKRDLSLSLDLGGLFGGFDLSNTNHYGAPNPPWVINSKPGWYYGPHPGNHPDLPCLGGLICKILDLIPWIIHCPHQFPPPPPPQYPPPTTTTSSPAPTSTSTPPPPPPSDGYYPTFTNITAAVQADDYMTFGLVETVADCKAMCNSVSGCGFVNTYHDVNGKDGSPLLTCALFQGCHGPEDADNAGGQTQPDGSVDFITDSDGWCKQ